MKIHEDCRPCLIRQMRTAARAAGADEGLEVEVARAAREKLEQLWDAGSSPPAVSAPLYRLAGRMCGTDDPYLAQKVRYTREALKMLPAVEARISAHPDPFLAAVRAAIAGNVVDFGTGSGEDGFDLKAALDEFLAKPMLHDDVEALRQQAATAHTILFIGDNAGETVFDRPLLGRLGAGKLYYAAKGGAIINDATVSDATLAGVHLHAELVSTGARTPGTIPDQCSPRFRELFRRADLVIAKGQGNFETLTELPPSGRVFMLFVVKCPVAAGHVDGSLGDMVVMRW